MSLTKKERDRILKQHCGVINDDDAIDPRHYFANKRKSKSKHRKAFQLCRQVSETLQMVLTGTDPSLDGMSIVDVVPAPDARRMLVIVGIDSDCVVSASDMQDKLAELQRHIPRLRSEIAQSISRRKTPQLIFEISPL